MGVVLVLSDAHLDQPIVFVQRTQRLQLCHTLLPPPLTHLLRHRREILVALPQQRRQERQDLAVESDAKLFIGRELRQLLVDLFDDVDLRLFEEDQILLLILFAIFPQSFVGIVVLRVLPKRIPVGKPKPVVFIVSQLLDNFEHVLEEQEGESTSVERVQLQIVAVLDQVVHEPAEVELTYQNLVVFVLEFGLEFALGGVTVTAFSTGGDVSLDIYDLVLGSLPQFDLGRRFQVIAALLPPHLILQLRPLHPLLLLFRLSHRIHPRLPLLLIRPASFVKVNQTDKILNVDLQKLLPGHAFLPVNRAHLGQQKPNAGSNLVLFGHREGSGTHLADQFLLALALPGSDPHDHLVQDDAHREDVALRGVAVLEQRFERHVQRRAHVVPRLGLDSRVNREAEVSQLPVLGALEDVGRFHVAVHHAHTEEVLDSLNDLADDGDGLLLTKFAVLGDVFQQVAVGTVLGDEVAVGGGAVDVFELEDVGVRQPLEDVDLVVQHLQTRGGVLLQLDYLHRVVVVVLAAPASVDVAGVARTDLVLPPVGERTDRLAVLAEHRRGLPQMQTTQRPRLPQLPLSVLLQRVRCAPQLLWRKMPLSHRYHLIKNRIAFLTALAQIISALGPPGHRARGQQCGIAWLLGPTKTALICWKLKVNSEREDWLGRGEVGCLCRNRK